MKRIIAFILTLVLLLFSVACESSDKTGSKDGQTTNDGYVSENSSDDLPLEEEPKEIEIDNDGFCLVVKMKSTNATVNSTDDFSKYTVAYISDTDSEKYAKFYDFKEIGMYNSAHDLHSGLVGGAVELGIINDVSYEANIEDYDIVWDFSKNN